MREHFLLDPAWAFLNHGSFGATPRPVLAAYHRWQYEMERQPVAYFQRELTARLDYARAVMAAYLGADAAGLHFVRNVTVGMNVVARSVPLGPGDEVLLTDHEYGAVTATWQFVAGGAGARVVVQPVAVPYTSDADFMAQLWAGVTARTRVIVVSHLTSPTAIRFPVAAVVARARAAGILTVIDGAHTPGQLPLGLDALGADYYLGNFHKWFCAPKSAGFLYTRPEHGDSLYPLVVSWGWIDGETPVGRLSWQGTDDVAAYLTLPDVLAFREAHDWDAVIGRCRALALAGRGRLVDALGGAATAPAGDVVQLFAVELPPCDPVAVQDALHHAHRVEVPVIAWGGRQFVRVSVQGYNTADDLARLLAGLRAVLG